MPFGPDGPYALDDHFLRDRLRDVIVEQNIDLVVETGLNQGRSTLEFCRIAPLVYGIDHNPLSVYATRERLRAAKVKNFKLWLGHSPDAVKSLVSTYDTVNMLLFLDAHWGPGWPLPDEIRALNRGKGILVFHDIKVPGTDFRWDTYQYQPGGEAFDFSYEVVKDVLTEWSPTHRVEYMTQASGSYRGACIVYP